MSQINLLIFRFVMYLANKLLSLSCPVVRFLTFLYVYLSELNSFFCARVLVLYACSRGSVEEGLVRTVDATVRRELQESRAEIHRQDERQQRTTYSERKCAENYNK